MVAIFLPSKLLFILSQVKDFAQSGRKVIATARDPSSATQLKEVQAKHGDSVIIVALDVSKTTEVPSVGKLTKKDSAP